MLRLRAVKTRMVEKKDWESQRAMAFGFGATPSEV